MGGNDNKRKENSITVSSRVLKYINLYTPEDGLSSQNMG
jgi:hypothetical protein